MKEVTCNYCGHVQNTRSKLIRVTCSNCGKKFNKNNNNNSSPMKEKVYYNNSILEENNNKEVTPRVKLD